VKHHSGLIAAGETLTLSCSCEAEVVVPLIIMLPRHHVVRILAPGEWCRTLHHLRGDRIVVRSEDESGGRVFADIHAT
jgi:hypothetical protein